MFFERRDYDTLAAIVFRPSYPGWNPDVEELPNGDGKIDVKKYAHIAPKYLPGFGTGRERTLLMRALFRAHEAAEAVADALNVPQAFRPDIRYGAVRILAYPQNTGVSHLHRDFDLFTIPLFQESGSFERDLSGEATDAQRAALEDAEELAPGLHLGELGELVGLGPATPHEVKVGEEGRLSAVYFAIPDWGAKLPEGREAERIRHFYAMGKNQTVIVKDWLNERMQRSRTAFKAYE